jgi:N-methylhydantoinase A
MAISVEAAEAALQRLADKVGLSASEVAWGIHNSVNENMASAARVHIAELGKDARRYTMLPTGGGGPLHCCEVSRKLGISRVICPPSAGVASAVGLLVAPARVDRARTYVATLVGLDWTDFESAYRALETDAAAVIEETLGRGSRPKITRFADMRYVGQGFDLVVALPDGPYTAESMADLRNSFAAMYREIFGRSMDAADIQVMNIRIAAQMAIKEAALQSEPHGKELAQALKHRRKAYFESARAYLDTPVYARSLLPAGASLDGPAIVEEPESTLIVPPGASFAVAQNGAITIDLLVQNAHEEVAA